MNFSRLDLMGMFSTVACLDQNPGGFWFCCYHGMTDFVHPTILEDFKNTNSENS